MTAATVAVRVRAVSRSVDEALLDMLLRRHLGESASNIAERYELAQQEVSRRTNKVFEADLSTPDPRAGPAEIRRAYW